jgi:hypothetical protein
MLKVSFDGNAKLGKVATLSRAVGPSCPSNCGYLNNGCYAQKVERIYPSAKRAWAENLKVHELQQYRAFFLQAYKKGIPVRLHVAGDFLKTQPSGRKVVDTNYIKTLETAYLSINKERRPQVWLYTHVNSKHILKLRNIGFTVYASIDSDKDYARFKKTGFNLFAFGSKERKGKSDKKLEQTLSGKAPVCWEQLGTKADCASCGYCVKGLGNIVFLKH